MHAQQAHSLTAGRRAACCSAHPQVADEVLVFAAASLTDALEEIAASYREANATVVKLSFASSSTLARQIEAGAPAHLFASADQPWMDYLAERGLVLPETRVSPIGTALVLVAPVESAVALISIDAGGDLAALLGRDGRLAVGDPEHVPAGKYAQPALSSLGLWSALERRLARADNVRATLALVARGEAPLGIVYATDARVATGVKVLGTFPAASHPPISYRMALDKGGDTPGAHAFFRFLTGQQGLSVLQRQGFSLSGPDGTRVAPH